MASFKQKLKQGTPEQFRQIVAGRFKIPVENLSTKAIMENHRFLGLKVYDEGNYKGDFIFAEERNNKNLSAEAEKKISYNIIWKKETELPEFDDSIENPTDPYRHHDMKLVMMPVKEYIELQLKRQPALIGKDEYLMKGGLRGAIGLYEGVKKGDRIPTPVLEYDEGKLTSFQEGYRRGKIAELFGEKEIPVWIATKRHIVTVYKGDVIKLEGDKITFNWGDKKLTGKVAEKRGDYDYIVEL